MKVRRSREDWRKLIGDGITLHTSRSGGLHLLDELRHGLKEVSLESVVRDLARKRGSSERGNRAAVQAHKHTWKMGASASLLIQQIVCARSHERVTASHEAHTHALTLLSFMPARC